MESEQKELTVCSITGLIPTDKKVSEKKQITIGKEEGITVGNENKGKYINHDIIINHFEVEHFNLSDTIELLSNYLDEYIKKEYPGKDIKVKILNTLSGNDKNLPLITINADKITIENLVSMICKETGLKYVIGKDAIYIGY